MDDLVRRLRDVLAGQTYPAARWELIAAADAYGVDARTRAQLLALPVGRYPSFVSVTRALHAVIRVSAA